MKYLKSVIPIVLILILFGCNTNTEQIMTNNSNERPPQLKNITDLEANLKAMDKKLILLEEKLEEETNKNYRLERVVKEITELREFNYEVLSKGINREPSDAVIYIANIPDTLEEQEIYILTTAIHFNGGNYNKVSIWKDKATAMKYISGEFDPEEGILGWSGYDDRIGFIDNINDPPSLRHYFSRDDGQMLEFGKYKYE
jgi:hypothetical protein